MRNLRDTTRTRRYLVVALVSAYFGIPMLLHAKTVEPLYADPFDIGSGGALLTRATQGSMLLSNPAQLPYGGKILRWLGLNLSLYAGKDSVDLAQQLAKQQQPTTDQSELFDKVLAHPVHVGIAQAVSFITNNFGVMAFSSIEPDIRVWKRGDPTEGSGLPNFVFRNETYSGAVLALATQSPWRALSFGVNAKYLLVNDLIFRVDFSDSKAAEKIQDKLAKFQNLSTSAGLGYDVSTLYFAQGQHLDFRCATVVENVGGLKLGANHELKQTLNVGTGFTIHDTINAAHLAIDYRDVQNVHDEKMFKRVYLSTKFLLYTYLGLGAGIYHGTPSYAIEADLLLVRLTAGVYTREYGDSPGVDPRTIYILSLAMGFDF